jgi:hypothetical protein
MKVCINDNCYTVVRVIKNGTALEKEFLEKTRDNRNADTMISDGDGNILLCKKTIDYRFNEITGKWNSVESKELVIEDELKPIKKSVAKKSRIKRKKKK